ncbi:MAG TPA: AsmA family protein [Candidatus Sulfotelmatobacter sp.]|jgi:AsmA protein|nr:AsmA family protein [Candidatus Sulfotelmatobacter sp.]
MNRTVKIVAIIVGVLILIIIAIPFFIDANSFRPRLESELTNVLGRQVKVGNLSLSLFSGSVAADDISIADDPAFSKSPFVQAKSLKVGVELIPLIFSKTLNVTNLTLNQPEISLVRSQNGEKWNFSSLGGNNTAAQKPAGQAGSTPAASTPNEKAAPANTSAPPANTSSSPATNPNVSIAKLNVSDGRLTVSKAGSSEKPRVYDKVDITMSDFSFTSSFPFTVTAQLPGNGTLKLDGKAGPINANDAAQTPLEAKITVQKMNLAESGFIDPAAGISGIADFDGNVTSDGHEAKTTGALKTTNLQVVKKGSPAGKPVQVNYTVNYDLAKQTGTIPQCVISAGKAVAHLTGTYDAHGQVTSVNLKFNGQGMPVDDLEAILPAVGVILPPKSQLKGGDLNTDLTIVGPVDKLVTTGSVKMENTTLANFNLGSKLSAISSLSGKSNATGNDTTIQNFSSNVRVAPDGTRADNINLTVPAIGVVTGAGVVSPSNELAFKLNANVGGLGAVPIAVSGTTSDPKFMPDVKGLASGLLKNALSGKSVPGQQNPVNSVMGLFNKKKPQ